MDKILKYFTKNMQGAPNGEKFAGVNSLQHYLLHGQAWQREPMPHDQGYI